jgi:uncharacterized protein (DUF2141 family)
MLRSLACHRAELPRLAFGIFTLVASTVQAEPQPEMGSSITAVVGPLRNAKGAVACRLFKSGKGFPRSDEGTLTQRVAITGTSARCTFTNVQPGNYAIMVHHDENANRKFDKNFLGLPLEGYGGSNNRLPALQAPSWEDCKFVVERAKPRMLTISLRY